MKKIFTLLILFHLFFPFLQSQNTTDKLDTSVDSLEQAVNRATSDTARLTIILNFTKYIRIGKSDKLINIGQKGYEIASQTGNDKACMDLAFFLGEAYMYDKSKEGVAFEWFQKGVKTAEKTKDNARLSEFHYKMGIVYDHQNFRDKMYLSFLTSIDYAAKRPNFYINPYLAIVINYCNDQRFDEALVIGKKGLMEIQNKAHKAVDKIALYNSLYITLSSMPNKKQEAETYRTQLNSYLDTTSLADKSLTELNVLEAVCENIHRRDLQMKFAKQILTFEGDDNITKQIVANAHKVLSVCYEAEKNYPKSLEHERTAHLLEVAYVRNMMTEDAGRKIIRAESERDLLLKQQEVDKQKWVSILGFSIVAFMFIGGVIFYRFYKREQERKNELTVLNATKDRLFAILTHDLMSPVATLKNYTMLMDWGAMDQAEFTESVQSLKTNVNNLYLMLENVLHWSISQMKGIKTKIEKVNIDEVINEQVALLQPIAKGKNIYISQSIPSDMTIDVDRNHLALIVRNLLQNALKFTHSGGQISFNALNTDLSSGTHEGGKKTITLQDTGIGMSQNTIDKLFKVEQNAHREGTDKEGGTGLGLILTKELVELNSGTIMVSSEEGKGTRFSMTF